MTLRQREPRREDPKHLAFVRLQPCCVCGSTRNVEAAHLKLRRLDIGKESPGMQQKADDRWVTPLCHYHHQSGILAQHRVGEQRFWFEIHGRNPFEIAERLWIASGGAERAARPAPVKKPRKIKGRDPNRLRRKIQSNPKIQSRGFASSHRRLSALDLIRPVMAEEATNV